MKVSIFQENFSDALSKVGRAVATRSTLPITGNVLIKAKGSEVKLSATNLEIAISTWVEARVDEDGEITVPAKLLSDFINSLPEDILELETQPEKNSLRIRCGRFDARISGQPAEDFPPIPEVPEGIRTKVDPEILRKGIRQVVFSAATEESRPVLTGIHSEFEGRELTLAAADGFRLAVKKLPLLDEVPDKLGVIIPAKSYGELQRLLADEDEPVDIVINPERNQVLFKMKGSEMVSQLIQGTFPNYSQLIPKSYVTRAVVDVSDFMMATKSASIFVRDGGGIIRLIITEGKMSVIGRAEEVGDNVCEIDAAVEGEDAKIAFNSKYLTDVLNVIEGEKVAIEITNPSSPGVFKPEGDKDYVYVVMPMFVSW